MWKFNKGLLWVLALATCGALVTPPPAVSQSQAESFCEGFEDGNWPSRWTQGEGIFTIVDSLRHSGDSALMLRGPYDGACGASVNRTGFQACTGEYSAWANQRHFEAGFSILVQVQPGASQYAQDREGYELQLMANDSQGPFFFVLIHRHETGPGTLLASKPTSQFLMGEWIRMFIRRLPGNTLVAGYERNGVVDSVVAIDPTPVMNPGDFYLWSCSDGPPTNNFFDDVCYEPLSCSDGPICFDLGADLNCDGAEDVFDVVYLIDYVFSGGPPRVPCPQK